MQSCLALSFTGTNLIQRDTVVVDSRKVLEIRIARSVGGRLIHCLLRRIRGAYFDPTDIYSTTLVCESGLHGLQNAPNLFRVHIARPFVELVHGGLRGTLWKRSTSYPGRRLLAVLVRDPSPLRGLASRLRELEGRLGLWLF